MFLCVRVVFQALLSLCVLHSVSGCLTQHVYQEKKQVTLAQPNMAYALIVLGGIHSIRFECVKCVFVIEGQAAEGNEQCCGNTIKSSTLASQMCSSTSRTANTQQSITRDDIFAFGCTELAGCFLPGKLSIKSRGSWMILHPRSLERRNQELSLLEIGRKKYAGHGLHCVYLVQFDQEFEQIRWVSAGHFA